MSKEPSPDKRDKSLLIKSKLMQKHQLDLSETKRCGWCLSDPIYIEYHDNEWGKPVRNDRKLFEFIVLESAQAGLSWITILRKRENYRKAFAGFDPEKIARFGTRDVTKLLGNAGIVRNRGKIEAAIGNAKIFLDLQEKHGSFSKFIWNYIDNEPIVNRRRSLKDIPPRTNLSDKISSDLKKLGFKFFGSTICYAHMQATGMVNDHLLDCVAR